MRERFHIGDAALTMALQHVGDIIKRGFFNQFL